MKIDTKAGGAWLHKKYKVKSLNELSEKVLNDIITALRDIQGNTPDNRREPIVGVLTPEELKDEIMKGVN